ncbi:lysine biosynthesis protein LysW [Peribacillus sp. NPDC006672]|uniref:lysine biosynthesis protein LysW n=1 Tax=Peribacillus sp. NPDC006672 TaxID=3390606 RepID=UPI003D05727A
MSKLNCVVCNDDLQVAEDVIVGEIVECTSCGQEHEVQTVGENISIGLAPEIEETWGE